MSNWATNYIIKLLQGESVSFKPRGNSMSPKIKDGQLVICIPVKDISITLGDVVLCNVKGNHYLHIVKAIDQDRYLIGNNKSYINGWTSKTNIYGKVI
jgi:hypothetical protein